jgi:hypothetical protein
MELGIGELLSRHPAGAGQVFERSRPVGRGEILKYLFNTDSSGFAALNDDLSFFSVIFDYSAFKN